MCLAVLQNISTGCRTIDKALEGGIPFDSVSLIYGEAETGKTTLALQLAINCAAKGYKTLFVDCDGTFSAERLSQMASEKFKEIAELIILMRPNNFREQTLVIDQLTDYISKNFGLVIIDTMTGLYRARVAEFPERTFELNRELNRQMALLAQIAKTQKIRVVLTSQVHSIFNEARFDIEPVATRVLKFWVDTIIAMKPTENPRIINAILEKSPRKTKGVQPLTCHLEIGETGIHEYPIH
jgi:DNA repair protein RadB